MSSRTSKNVKLYSPASTHSFPSKHDVRCLTLWFAISKRSRRTCLALSEYIVSAFWTLWNVKSLYSWTQSMFSIDVRREFQRFWAKQKCKQVSYISVKSGPVAPKAARVSQRFWTFQSSTFYFWLSLNFVFWPMANKAAHWIVFYLHVRAGKLEEAGIVLRRFKLMENEIASANEMLAAQD